MILFTIKMHLNYYYYYKKIRESDHGSSRILKLFRNKPSAY